MVNKLDHSGKSKKISITASLKKTLSARNFFYMTKASFVQLKGGFKGHKHSVEFFAGTFNKRSPKQKVSHLHYFCTMLYPK